MTIFSRWAKDFADPFVFRQMNDMNVNQKPGQRGGRRLHVQKDCANQMWARVDLTGPRFVVVLLDQSRQGLADEHVLNAGLPIVVRLLVNE